MLAEKGIRDFLRLMNKRKQNQHYSFDSNFNELKVTAYFTATADLEFIEPYLVKA